MTIVKIRADLPAVSSRAPRSGAVWLATSVVAVLAIVAVLLLSVGVNPLDAASAMWTASFGSSRAVGETLIRATPLLMIAVTLVPSLRAGLYNIGAPGQMGAGALAATWIALHTAGWNHAVVLILCAVAGCAAGTAMGFIPGWLKARWRSNEIITTLALNFIMLSVLGYLLNGSMQSDFANLPQSDSLPPSSSIPTLIPGTRAHIGLLIALLAVPLLWALNRSRLGYRLRVFGANASLARQAKVKPGRYVMGLMALGGAGAGLAGWMQVAAVDHRLYPGIADPVGYAGLFVALLGALHPIGIVIAALSLGMLTHGGESLQVGAGVSPEIVQVLLGLILLAYAMQVTAHKTASSDQKGAWKRWISSKR